jgi:hypothetical protein
LDALFYDAAIRRMLRTTLLLGMAGALTALVLWGWPSGAGFVLGAGLSYGNFRLWIRMVQGLGDPGNSTRGAVFLGLRYLLVAGATYVIIVVSGVSLRALLAGLLVAVAAVIVEIVYELIFVRS